MLAALYINITTMGVSGEGGGVITVSWHYCVLKQKLAVVVATPVCDLGTESLFLKFAPNLGESNKPV